MTPHTCEEVDAWWGSYSIRGTLPGLLVGLAGSALVVGTAWLFPHGRVLQLIVLGFLGTCWLALVLLWIYLIFGLHYRLTTCRLFVETGLVRRRVHSVDLANVVQVGVQANRLDRYLGLGRVVVEVGRSEVVILDGVCDADEVAEQIRKLAQTARERQPAAEA